jgi:hypothetical protein
MVMELVADYLFKRYIPKRDPLPFPQYLEPKHKWDNGFWITKDGECVHPWEMNDGHLVNTLRMIHRSRSDFKEAYDRANSDKYILQGMKVFYDYKRLIKFDVPIPIELYCDLWTDRYLYMLLRREFKLRGLEYEI